MNLDRSQSIEVIPGKNSLKNKFIPPIVAHNRIRKFRQTLYPVVSNSFTNQLVWRPSSQTCNATCSTPIRQVTGPPKPATVAQTSKDLSLISKQSFLASLHHLFSLSKLVMKMSDPVYIDKPHSHAKHCEIQTQFNNKMRKVWRCPFSLNGAKMQVLIL